jgi:hypothetical protein
MVMSLAVNSSVPTSWIASRRLISKKASVAGRSLSTPRGAPGSVEPWTAVPLSAFSWILTRSRARSMMLSSLFPDADLSAPQVASLSPVEYVSTAARAARSSCWPIALAR